MRGVGLQCMCCVCSPYSFPPINHAEEDASSSDLLSPPCLPRIDLLFVTRAQDAMRMRIRVVLLSSIIQWKLRKEGGVLPQLVCMLQDKKLHQNVKTKTKTTWSRTVCVEMDGSDDDIIITVEIISNGCWVHE